MVSLATTLLPASFYTPLQRTIRSTSATSAATETYHRQTMRKGIVAMAIYLLGVPLTFLSPWLGVARAVLVAILWFFPDSRFDALFGD